jgi:hypothetical protein
MINQRPGILPYFFTTSACASWNKAGLAPRTWSWDMGTMGTQRLFFFWFLEMGDPGIPKNLKKPIGFNTKTSSDLDDGIRGIPRTEETSI